MSKVVAINTRLTDTTIANHKVEIIRLHGKLWDVCGEMSKLIDEDIAESKKYRADLITRQQYMTFLSKVEERKTVLLTERDEIKAKIDEISEVLKNTWNVEYD